MDILYLSEVSPNRQNTLNYHVTNWGFHKCTELAILALIPTLYVLPYFQFPSLFAPHDVTECKIMCQWVSERLYFKVVKVIGIDCHLNVTAKIKLAIL